MSTQNVYVGSYSNFIFHLSRDAGTNALTLVEAVPCHGLQPSFVALSADGRTLYAALEHGSDELAPAVDKSVSGAVAAFAVDASTGRLTFINVVRSEGPWPCHVSVSGDGCVAVANYGGGCALLATDASTGALVAATAGGISVNARPDRAADYACVLPGQGNRQDATHSHSANFVAGGKLLLVPDLGLDTVWAYNVDAATASLVPCAPSPGFVTADGEGPRHLVEDPASGHVYVCCELSNKVYKLALNATTGAMTQVAVSAPTVPVLGEYAAVPPPCEAGAFNGEVSCCADIHLLVKAGSRRVAADITNVIVSNRGADTLTFLTANLEDKCDEHESGGKTPRNFLIDQSGEGQDTIFICNQNESTIRVKAGVWKDAGGFEDAGEPIDFGASGEFGPEWKWPCCIVLGK